MPRKEKIYGRMWLRAPSIDFPAGWDYNYSPTVAEGAVELIVRGMNKITLSREMANVWSISMDCDNPNRVTCRDIAPWRFRPPESRVCKDFPVTRNCIKKQYGGGIAGGLIASNLLNDDNVKVQAYKALEHEDLIASTTNPWVPITWRIALDGDLGWVPYGEISMAPWANVSTDRLKISTRFPKEEVLPLLLEFMSSMQNGGMVQDIQCGGEKTMKLRIGRDEVQGGNRGHFHLEEIKTHESGQTYICNHGIFFPTSGRLEDFFYALLGLFV